jgi:hypothetical protein
MAKYYKAGDFEPPSAALRELMPCLVHLAQRYLKRKSIPAPARQAAACLVTSVLADRGRGHAVQRTVDSALRVRA